MERTAPSLRMLRTKRALQLSLLFSVLQPAFTEDPVQNTTDAENFAPRRLFDKDSPDVRPSAGEKVDVIEVGILCKSIKNVDVAGGLYTADIVLTIRWTDPRVAELLPDGRETFTLSKEAADKDIWVPNIVPTNRDIQGLEEISQTTEINSDGIVLRTRRMLVRMRQMYSLAAYPYDKQGLQVVVASSAYMFDQVELAVTEDKELKGVDEQATGTIAWDLVGWSMTEVKETSASLKKSRCVLLIEIERKPQSVYQGTVMPECLLVFIAWCVFFLPMMVQFVVPRVATCLICFLTMNAMTTKTLSALPDTGELTWIQTWEMCCSHLLFLSAVFNAGTEVIYMRFDMKPFAERLRLEMAGGFFILAVLLAWVTHSRTDGEGLVGMLWLARGMIAIALIVFGGRGASSVYREFEAKS